MGDFLRVTIKTLVSTKYELMEEIKHKDEVIFILKQKIKQLKHLEKVMDERL